MNKLEIIPPDCIKGCLIHPGPDRRRNEITQEGMLEIVKTPPKCPIPVFLGDKAPGSLPVGVIIDFEIKEGALYVTIKIYKNYTGIVDGIKNNELNILGFSGLFRKITQTPPFINNENIKIEGIKKVSEVIINFVCIKKQDKEELNGKFI